MATLLQDVRYGLRQLRRNPGFTAVAIITLAAGIGANTAIFSVVNAVLLRPLPYKNPQQLVQIRVTEPSGPGDLFPVSGPDFVDWRAQNRAFQSLVAASFDSATLMGASEPLHISGFDVSPNIFSLLGFEPLAGRTFNDEETQPGHNRVVILSYGLWQRAFGGDRALIGRNIRMNGEVYNVVGIMPRSFRFPTVWQIHPEYWMPLNLKQPKWKTSRGNHWLQVLGRMKPGVSLAAAQTEMDTISHRLAHQYPEADTGVTAKVASLHSKMTHTVRPAILVLFAAVGFLLLIACANVSSLLLARGIARQREVAVRLAVGAGRLRLTRQFLTESVVLFLFGGVAGLAVGWGALRLLVHSAPAGYVPSIIQIHLDLRVFAFTFAAAFVAGVLAGLAPAAHASRPDIQESLKEGGRTSAAPHARSRRVLTAVEIALALVMLTGAGLALRSLVKLLGVQAGFDPNNVLTARLDLPSARYSKDSQVVSFYEQLLDRVRALPGVVSAAGVSALPLEGQGNGVVYIEGEPIPKNMWSSPLVEWYEATPDYFKTMRIPMLRGRDFTLRDAGESPQVAVINEAMADRFWRHQNPIGKRFTQGYSAHPKWITVIGVTGNVPANRLGAPPMPAAYFPQYLNGSGNLAIAIRTSIPPMSQLPAIRGVVRSLDSQLPLYHPETMDQIISQASGEQQFMALLLTLFAGIAVVLAAVGVYGVVSYSVAQRTHEMGIRMALGAQRSDVLKLVLAQGMTSVLAGLCAGVIAALGLTRLMASLLYGVKPWDPLTFVIVSAGLAGIGLAASFIPARRAANVDPIIALHRE
ncbi:MAG: ABC transporter permease [Acidobacteriota bacterium]|nr:ABC transporter permease [Acidobacteriota bacterium]